jgi:hypothetical protein
MTVIVVALSLTRLTCREYLLLSLFRAVGHVVWVGRRVCGGKEERYNARKRCLFIVADDEEFSHKPNLNLEEYFNISRVFARNNINDDSTCQQ